MSLALDLHAVKEESSGKDFAPTAHPSMRAFRVMEVRSRDLSKLRAYF